MSRDDATVVQIVAAARLVQAFVAGYTEEDFARDQRTRSAVLYQVLVIGEAAKPLSEEFKQRNSAIP